MDTKLLLSKCISLLYRESQTTETENSKKLVLDVVTGLKIKQADTDNGIDTIYELRNLVVSMTERNTGMPYAELMQHLKIICDNDTNLYESIADAISMELPLPDIQNIVLSYRYELNKYIKSKAAQDELDKLVFDLKFKKDDIGDVNMYISNRLNKIMDGVNANTDEGPGVAVEIDFDDLDSLAEQFKTVREENAGKRIIKTPWIALNRMIRGGLRLGELTTIAAAPHCNKSGTSLSIFCGAALYNNPYDLLKDHTKKPLIILFSFEDQAPLVVNNLYTLLKGNLENVIVTDEERSNLNETEAAQWCHTQLKRNGYHIKIIRDNPDEWTYLDIQNKILYYESKGYEIHLAVIDYLSLVSKKGLSADRLDENLQELFRRTKNFFSSHSIAVVTPHQLSTEAIALRREGNKMLVKDIADGGYYKDSRGLSREPDLELFIDKVIDNGIPYQTFARGKHRGQNDTPEEDKFFILRFQPCGGIRWDIEGTDTSTTRFGAVRNDSGDEELAFYDLGEGAA